MEWLIFVVILTVVLSAFFSGMEIAFVSSNKLQIEVEKNRNKVSRKLLSVFTDNPQRYIATMLVGNNIALVIYGLAFSDLLDPFLKHYIASSDSAVLLIQTLISTLLILVLAEFTPKTLFRLDPNRSLKIFSFPVSVFYYIFYPITSFSLFLSKFLIKRVLSKDYQEEEQKNVFGHVDLDDLVESSTSGSRNNDAEEQNEIRLFRNALDFSKVKIRECMVPRPELEAVEDNISVMALRDLFVSTGFSKILIYKENIDNIIGYVHSSDLFKKPTHILEIMRQISFIPETMDANKQLKEFFRTRQSIAVVVDEFGGTAGIVTNEDILEEIFGEIQDEHDVNTLKEYQIAPKEYVLSGRLEIDYLNNKYDLDIPEKDNYETLAGYILYNYESLPKINTVITIDEFELKILSSTKTRIELVKLVIK